MNFKNTIEQLMEGIPFTEIEAFKLMINIGYGPYNDAQNAALIISLSSRDLNVSEISGFKKALLNLSVPTTLESYNAIDLCGTGGDGKNTFNISTLTSFVVAAAGYKVAKHGNYGVSSVSGSSNVLEYLGYRFSNKSDKLEREINENNICFLHAPLFHPALKIIGGIRKQLGIRTLFNIMGPLVNPAKTKKQFVGVFNLKLARLYNYFLQNEDKQYTVVHSIDGYDEISLTDKVQFFSHTGEKLYSPEDLGFRKLDAKKIEGGNNIEESAKLFVSILQGNGTDAQNEVVIVNAAAAIQCFHSDKNLYECSMEARESLNSKKAYITFDRLINNP